VAATKDAIVQAKMRGDAAEVMDHQRLLVRWERVLAASQRKIYIEALVREGRPKRSPLIDRETLCAFARVATTSTDCNELVNVMLAEFERYELFRSEVWSPKPDECESKHEDPCAAVWKLDVGCAEFFLKREKPGFCGVHHILAVANPHLQLVALLLANGAVPFYLVVSGHNRRSRAIKLFRNGHRLRRTTFVPPC
jgi:hypothetical protein